MENPSHYGALYEETTAWGLKQQRSVYTAESIREANSRSVTRFFDFLYLKGEKRVFDCAS